MSEHNNQTQELQPQSPSGNPPVITHWDGPVFAKVWENESPKGGIYFNVRSGKLYTDPKTGQTRETQTLQKSDLPKMQFVMGEAYRSISLLQQNIKQDYKPENEQDWLSAPNGSATPTNAVQNGLKSPIENGRARTPEM